MKCLNCGRENDHYLCSTCTTAEVLDKVFNDIRTYKPDACENPYLAEFAAGLTEKYAERDIIPEILEQFDSDVTEYYYCRYFRMRRDDRFEDAAIAYLQSNKLTDIHTQYVLSDLISSYMRNDYIKPKKWCETIVASDALCCDLYALAAEYFSMIGEYDVADRAVDKGLELCRDIKRGKLLYGSFETMIVKLEKQKEATDRYRTKKPYWPNTEERRRAVAMFYDEKGISYPRIESRPKKVPEDDFAPIKECYEGGFSDYCAFWCSEAFSFSSARCIYQIGAVKVRNNKTVDTFELFIRPWDARSDARKAAAKEVGVSLDMIESAEDVDLVLPKFFDFVGDDVLVSTDAFGSQAKLISRAARYAGMYEIKNEFYDVLDLAADTSNEFDLDNNNRAYLLSFFSVPEGKTAVDKAVVNKQLYDLLLNYGD